MLIGGGGGGGHGQEKRDAQLPGRGAGRKIKVIF